MTKTDLDILVEDCVYHRLKVVESIEYIQKRTVTEDTPKGTIISESTYKRKKSYLLNHRGLNAYFDDHMRIGFIRDQRMRKGEMDAVMDELMRRWKDFVSKPTVDIREMAALAESINSINRSLREISLDNPIIAQIKQKIEEHDTALSAGSVSSIDYTQGTAFS